MTPGEIILRRFDLDAEDPCPALLSADEAARAARFRFARDARRWAVCRAALRRTLGAFLGVFPAALRFETGSYGKPFLPGRPLHFSVSHSEGTALMAFAWNQEIGVDIERRRPDFSPGDLLPSVFSAAERAWLSACAEETRPASFLTLWTAKEAYVKAGGWGLSFPVCDLTLLPEPDGEAFAVSGVAAEGQGISVRRVEVGDNYFAALAAAGEEPCRIDYSQCREAVVFSVCAL